MLHISSWLIYAIYKLVVGGGMYRWFIFLALCVFIHVGGGGEVVMVLVVAGCTYIVTQRGRRAGGGAINIFLAYLHHL